MTDKTIVILIVIAIILIYNKSSVQTYYYKFQNYITGASYVGSDDIIYIIQKKYNNQELAVKYLEEINKMFYGLAKHLKKKLKEGAYDNCPIKYKQTINILERYNPDVIVEGPLIPDESSYTINKGDLISMCIRDKQTLELEDFETIKFVALHELAHIACDVEQHEPEFWRSFKWILEESENAGVFKNINYYKFPKQYCTNHLIDYSPMYDESVKSNCK